jgi:chaperonin GroES
MRWLPQSRSLGADQRGGGVALQCSEAEEETTGGVLLTSSSKAKPLTGEVVAVGPGKGEEPMDVTVGAQVLYSKFSGSEFEVRAPWPTTPCARI